MVATREEDWSFSGRRAAAELGWIGQRQSGLSAEALGFGPWAFVDVAYLPRPSVPFPKLFLLFSSLLSVFDRDSILFRS
jgi:hypothetical protein